MAARLAVFDLDGTLTDTNAVDDRCFQRSVAEVLELGDRELDWSGAPHVTDSAIAAWCSEQYRGRELSPEEYRAILRRFVALLSDALSLDPTLFAPIPGAANVAAELQRAGWAIAIATGGWGASARLKLRAAALDVEGAPLASADDGLTRDEILRCAHARATAHYRTEFQRVVSIGDGVWDVHAAAALEWSFIGIARESHTHRLLGAGASVILQDYTDASRLLAALASAPIPRTASASRAGLDRA